MVEAIDGASVHDSISETVRRNSGRGMSLTPQLVDRPVIADKPLKVSVRGRTKYGAPISEMTNTIYQIKEVVSFVPAANVRYVVRGMMTETGSSVWIEEAGSAKVVGDKVEVKGSTKLGFMEK